MSIDWSKTTGQTRQVAEWILQQGWQPVKCATGVAYPTDKGWPNISYSAKDVLSWPADVCVGISHSSSEVLCIDADRHGAADGIETLENFQQLYERIPETWAQRTPRNGLHLWFKVPAALQGKLQQVDTAGVEIRVKTGQTVFYGQRSDGAYTWLRGHNPQEMDIAEAGSEVLHLIEHLQDLAGSKSKVPDTPAAAQRFKVPDAPAAGKRFKVPASIVEMREKTLFQLACSLQSKGLSDETIMQAVQNENLKRCNPPLDDAEVAHAVKQALKQPKGTSAYDSPQFAPLSRFRAPERPSEPFPVDALPEVLRDFCTEVAQAVQVSIDMAAVCALGAVSAAAMGRYTVQVKPTWQEVAQLYVLLIARPSDRKSPTIKWTAQQLYEEQKRYNAAHNADVSEYKARLQIAKKNLQKLTGTAGKAPDEFSGEVIEAQAELDRLEQSPIVPMAMLLDDATPEAIVLALQENHERCAIISSEAGNLFSNLMGRYAQNGSTGIDVLLKAYTVEPLRVSRATKPSVTLQNPSLTILLTGQPSLLQSIMDDGNLQGRGLLSRFLFCVPESLVGGRTLQDAPINPDKKGRYDLMLHDLFAAGAEGQSTNFLTLTPEASALFDAYYDEVEHQLPELTANLEAWYGKLCGQVARIAALLTLCTASATCPACTIGSAEMQAAIALGRYFAGHARYAFGASGQTQAEQEARALLQAIMSDKLQDQRAAGRMTQRELFSCVSRVRFPTADSMDSSLLELQQRGYISRQRVSAGAQGGRPSMIIYLNPEAFDVGGAA